MRANTLRYISAVAFATAVLVVVFGLGGPTAVVASLGLGDHRAAGAAGDIAPLTEADAKTGRKLSQKTLAAHAAPAGRFGSPSGDDHYAELIPGAKWNPCAPVRFVLNTDNAPAGAVADFKVALRKASQASGLKLALVGTTGVYDPHWQDVAGRPVLVNWGKGTHGVLNEGAAGTAAPTSISNAAGEGVIVGAQITFSTTEDKYYPGGVFGTYGSRIALYMHEVAHVLGLDHVEDPNQLMFESVSMTKDFGAGDLAGLAAQGAGSCR